LKIHPKEKVIKTRRVIILLLLPFAVLTYILSIIIEREYQRELAQGCTDAGITQFPGVSGDLTFDPLGRLWVIVEGQHFKIYDGSQWEHFLLPNYDRFSHYATSIAFDKAGKAWVGTPTGLYSFDGKSWVIYTPQNSGMPWERVSALTIDSRGRLWMASSMNGLEMYDGRQWFGYPLQTDMIDEIAVDREGRVWIRNSGMSGLLMFQPGLLMNEQGTWTAFSPSDSALPGDAVFSLTTDAQGCVWMATDGGVAVVDGGSWTAYTTANSSLPSDYVVDIAIDGLGNVWAALWNKGIAVFDGTRWTNYTYENSGIFPGKETSTITDIAISPNGKAWLINIGGGGLFSISNLASVKRISPILVALRPYSFHPYSRWAIPFFLLMLWLGFRLRVQLPVAFGLALGVIPSVWYDGGLYFFMPGFVFCEIIGPICALIGGLIDVRKGRFGLRQRAGMIAGFLGVVVPFLIIMLLLISSS